MRQRFLPILLLSALLGCSKSDSNPIMDFGEGEGITYRDNTARPSGPQDPTDWTSDGEWNKQERALFSELSFNLNGAQQPALVNSTYLFANPAQVAQATWSFQTQRNTSGGAASYTIRAVIVDRKYTVMGKLGPNELILGEQFSLNYASMGLQPNELYRLYYVLYNSGGLVYKGHGDLRYSR
ncbi:hypothetical protein GCM10027594_09040 [Hymenobacter agri]